jgi:LacI family transcriptional regulator
VTTISDIARRAGVSTATVSRVLNGSPDVSAQLASRVRAAVQETGYEPSRIARSLRTQRSLVWSVIISDIRNPFFTELIPGVEEVAFTAGNSVILCHAGDDVARESTYVRLAAAENVAGVIISPASPVSTDVQPLVTRGIPVVTVDRRLRNVPLDHVLVDNGFGARQATEHLVATGAQRLACVSGPLSTTTGAERYAGYREALLDAGRPAQAKRVEQGDFHEEGGYQATRKLLAQRGRPDALFVCNNLMTIGALRAIDEAGLSIPDDIAVVGFDDPSWAALLRPPLTTVAQPSYDMGQEAARLLLSRINGYRGAAREVVLTPALRVRDSTLPLPS